MPPSKGHKKSRNGCTTCKRRRVKCDEGRPQCGNCTRRGAAMDCIYTSNSFVAEDRRPSIQSSSTTIVRGVVNSTVPSGQCICGNSHPCPTRSAISTEFPGALPAFCLLYLTLPSFLPNVRNDNGISLLDLSLLHHFTVSTSRTMTLGAQPEVEKIWSTTVPKFGQTYTFVMHALLAVAAAHLNTEETMPIGEHHFCQALQKMGVELQGSITDENCHALFVAISLLNVYVLSQTRYQHLLKRIPLREDEHDPFLNKLDTRWTFLTRTSFGILNESWTWVTRGPIASLLLPYPPTPKTMTPLSQPAEAVFLELLKLCSDVSIPGAADELGDVQNATAYFVAVWNLRKVWGVMEEYIDHHEQTLGTFPSKKIAALYSAIFQFVLRVPAKFWDALDRKKPRALIIYAYLAVCFESLDYSIQTHERSVNDDPAERDQGTRAWWISGRSERDLRCVENELRTLGVLELWKDWTARAWSIREKLRTGTWFDTDDDPFELAMITPDALALTVPQVSGSVIASQVEELSHFGPRSSLEDQWIFDMFDFPQALVHNHHAGSITAEGFIYSGYDLEVGRD